MPLTSEQHEQLTQFLTSPAFHRTRAAPAYDGPERRETPRTPARGPAELRLPPPEESPGELARRRSVTVYVYDVSTGGLGLFSGTAVHPSAVVDVVLSNGYDDLTVRCSIRHCTVLAAGLYGVGVDVVDFQVEPAMWFAEG
jgi:hypothetical protein